MSSSSGSSTALTARRGGGGRAPRQRKADDVDLLRAIAEGRIEELGVLFDRYNADLRRYFGRVGGGIMKSEVDDLVQLTFLEIMRAAARFDPERASARAWIFGIATMMIRRQRRSIARAIARVVQWTGIVQQQSDAVITPGEAYENDETARRLATALSRLSEKKREAFVLVSIEGFSGEEAARVLGIPVKTIWTRLHHARNELREALLRDDEAGEP
jgi:RNA polymerase sigma factor (sigma-70 family)